MVGCFGLAAERVGRVRKERPMKQEQDTQGSALVALTLPLDAIEADESWNTRRRKTDFRLDDDTPSDDQALRDSIRQSGILQPVGVREREPGEADGKPPYFLVFGFRRFQAARELGLAVVPAVVVPTKSARIANLAENASRRNLAPWELMEAVYRIRLEDKTLTTIQIGHAIGRHPNYIANLLRMRNKLCPELLSAYQVRGETMHMRYLIQVCALPADAQVASYNELVTGSRGGRPKGAKNGEKHAKGQFAEPKHLRHWLREVKSRRASASSFQSHRESAWLEGAQFILECAVGQRIFNLMIDDEDALG